MKIVIGGCGKIGRVLCRDLLLEGHEIMVIDLHRDVVESMIDDFDVTGITGSINSYDVLMEAGCNTANVFIATTGSDERNVIGAIIAKKLGCEYTIARVRDPSYGIHLSFTRDILGVSRLLNPELETARSLIELLQFPAAYGVERFVNGHVAMLEVKLGGDSQLVGKNMIAFREHFPGLIVCGVSRGDEAFIPGGTFILQKDDRLLVTGERRNLLSLYAELGTYTGKIRSLLLIGGGRITHYILRNLNLKRMKTTVIEHKEAVADEIAGHFPEVRVIVGDGTDYETLDEVGFEQVDAVAALTGVDEENVMIGMYAASKKIPRIFTKMNRTEMLSILDNAGLQSILTPKRIAADNVIRVIRALQNSEGSNVEKLYRLLNNQIEALEFRVAPDSSVINIPLVELQLKEGILIAFIYRKGQFIFPRGGDCILPGDRIVIVSKAMNFEDLDQILLDQAEPRKSEKALTPAEAQKKQDVFSLNGGDDLPLMTGSGGRERMSADIPSTPAEARTEGNTAKSPSGEQES